MPKPYPKEFRQGVVRVARSRKPGVTLRWAADFGVHPITLSKWLRRAETDEGARSAPVSGELAELREAASESGCWSRRTRSCAGLRRICRRRTCRQNDASAP
ncbi:transposase [Streptomyces sp. SID8352]|uniref:transposase n=1 Tax=Streptomyces sp. SID8352 TaxID=2690338 RepID=UPI0019282B15|nr:transposase [Streptomyces sp. SID8352]